MTKFLKPENEEGKIEYKLKLIDVSKDRLEKLASQMKYRLAEGGGEALYFIGVTDDGRPLGLTKDEEERTLENLSTVASIIGAKLQVVGRKKGVKGNIIEVLVRLSKEEAPPVHVSIAVLGNVDAGKSSLVGVLCTGDLDDGRGSAMRRIARYLHEVRTGRTSSVAIRLLGLNNRGEPVNWSLANPLDEAQIYMNSSKIITFIDVGGHERYLRTTLRGVMARLPDYSMLVVAANAGLLLMGKEHLGISIALRIPVFVVVTKIDMVSKEILDGVVDELVDVLRRVGKIPVLVDGERDIVELAQAMPSGRVVPIFKVSNTRGTGINSLIRFLNVLPPRMRWGEESERGLLMYIDDKFDVKGVGTVVAGLILSGKAREGETVYIGPFRDGNWRESRVKSIHINRLPVAEASAGVEATLALTNIEYEEVEKGMVVSNKPLKSIDTIEARITILRHSTTIKRGYETVLHLRAIRSTVRFTWLEKEPMRTGDTGRVYLKFVYHPWYLQVGEKFVLRDSRTRAIGTVLSTKSSS